MELTPGTKLGPYEIVAPIGAGGMGEVFKARDTRLDRTVAVKVMPRYIAAREDLRARFEREARTVSSLNHPNICILFDIGKQDGTDFMVLEYLEGETLAARVAKGPMPLDQVLKYATQIADALDRAHRSGVSHRDIKPANVMITRDGCKVLDFGLAKTAPKSLGPDDATIAASLTSEGTILGTPQYMAPEQYEGKEADARSDIFAFGCVLYEMVTGKRCFEGKTRASLIAAVLGADPAPMSAARPVTPASLEQLVRRCLEKDPENRYQSMRDVVLDLRSIGQSASLTQNATSLPRKQSGLAWIAAVVFALAAAIVSFVHFGEKVPELNLAQFSVEAPAGLAYTAAAAVSPDGRYLVFAARKGSENASLWLRPMGSLDVRQLPGTEGTNFVPFWSPDSKAVAFHSGGKLKRIDIAGGSPVVLCDWAVSPRGFGGTWNEDGVIVFALGDGLHRVSASGGVPVKLTQIDTAREESGFGTPQFLPGGRRFLYLIQSPNANTRGVYAGSLDRPQEKTRVLASDTVAVFAAPHGVNPGELLWLRDQTLMAQKFDSDSLRLTGDPVPVAESVDVSSIFSYGYFWVSDAGLLVYRTGDSDPKSRLVWMSRDGERLEEAAPEDDYDSFSLSHDGRRVAMTRIDSSKNNAIWVYELGRRVMTRLTFDSARDRVPVWSPDGRYVAFDSDRSGVRQIYRKDAGGSGQEEELTSSPGDKSVNDWSRDGKYIVYEQRDPRTAYDLWALPAEPDATGKRTPVLLLQTPFSELAGKLSPDGRWLAYQSNESGSNQVYVQAFPAAGSKWQVSNSGGSSPHWRGDGKEIYYETAAGAVYSQAAGNQGKVMAAGIKAIPSGIDVEAPHELFTVQAPSGNRDPLIAAPDGQHFLIDELSAATALNPLTVVENWQVRLTK
jgi:serine/threonine protein kinase/Tol biopolymer transport system component